MQCGRCQAQNREGRRFCAQCGAALAIACPACGFANEPDDVYCGGCGAALAAAEGAASAPMPAAPERGERRQLTVMFCDLAESTALLMRLDPEEMSGILRSYHRCCAEVVARFGGRVAKYMGDGILIYFGYPHAHEDDAERAVLAALAIVKEVTSLRPHANLTLQVRIGISTGLVVVGELIGEGASREQTVVGDTPTLAARLQSAAPPNAVVIAQSTHRLVGGLFECRDLGMLDLKGFAEAVRAWQVQGESRAESRFEALRAGETMIPIIGREQEIGLLIERWRRAQAGDGQVVLVAGDAGVGKSRLTSALREKLSGERHFRLSYYCSPHHQTSALFPIIAHMERMAGITQEDAGAERLDKLEAILQPTSAPQPETISLMAALLSVATGDRYPPLGLAPAQMKEKTLHSLLFRLEELASAKPVLCVFEDLHWVDPTSLELITRSIEPIKARPILLILTFRPEFDVSRFYGHEHVLHVKLNRLTRRQAMTMVEQRAGGKRIPAEVMDEIVAKADGVPLFLEELTKTVLESGLLAETEDRFTLNGPLPPLAVPATLHDSLMARLDRMSAVKQVAQLAATLGRSFTLEQLTAVSPLPPSSLGDALDQLVAAEIVHREDRPPHVLYEFKHALLRDVAYQSLLKATRQHYHERIARVLESKFPETAEVQPELLAYHFTEAGRVAEAIQYWLRAGKRAAQRSSNLEAIAQLTRALSLLDGLADAGERARREYQLRLALLTPVITAKGYGAPELEETFNRALRLSEEIGDTAEIFPILYSRHSFEMVTGQIRKGHVRGEEARRLAERHPQGDTGAFVGRLMGSPLLLAGNPVGALPLLEEALANYDFEKHTVSAHSYGQDHFVTCAGYLGMTRWHLGDIGAALAIQKRGLDHARALSHLNTLCFALNIIGGFLTGLLRDSEAMQRFASEILRLGGEHPIPVWTGSAKIVLGHALVEQGRVVEGIGLMETGIAGLHAIHIKIFSPMFLAWLAAGYARDRQAAQGLRSLDAASTIAEGGEHWMDAELCRLNGELRLLEPRVTHNVVEENLLAAWRISREQKSRSLALRAAASLGRYWSRRGQRSEAMKVLDEALAPFDTAVATPDLCEARAVRHEVA